MFDARVLLILLLSVPTGGRAFMIHHAQSSLCIDDSLKGEVLLEKCNLDSQFQQWIWIGEGSLMCIGSARCLSASQTEPVRTKSCQASTVDAATLLWDCDTARLISRNNSVLLSAEGQHLIVAHVSKNTKWKSLDEGDICQQKLRVRRDYNEPDEFEVAEGQRGMTEAQKEYFRWFYRSENSITWTFVLLGLSVVCLFVGFLLLGMGAVVNRSRKQIAKYKAAASLAQKSEGEPLQIVSPLINDSCIKPPASPLGYSGNIVVTWKDGNTSLLFSDPAIQEEKQVEDLEVGQKEMAAAETEAHNLEKTE